MKNLTTAIFAKCASGTDLHTDIGGRIYKGHAPEVATFPYVVFFVVSDYPEYPGNKTVEHVMIQFSLFSSANGSSEVEDMLTHLRSLYDDCSLSITGNTLIYFIRGNFTPMHDDLMEITTGGTTGLWHYVQEYDCQIVRA